MVTILNSWLHKKLIEPKYISLLGMCAINNFILITMKCWQKNFSKSLEWLLARKMFESTISKVSLNFWSPRFEEL